MLVDSLFAASYREGQHDEVDLHVLSSIELSRRVTKDSIPKSSC
jgi:hypothetical protein